MKTLKILLSSNGWEYSSPVTLTYKDKYDFKIEDPQWPQKDSFGDPTPNMIILDDFYIITFDEGFEIQGDKND